MQAGQADDQLAVADVQLPCRRVGACCCQSKGQQHMGAAQQCQLCIAAEFGGMQEAGVCGSGRASSPAQAGQRLKHTAWHGDQQLPHRAAAPLQRSARLPGLPSCSHSLTTQSSPTRKATAVQPRRSVATARWLTSLRRGGEGGSGSFNGGWRRQLHARRREERGHSVSLQGSTN